jgi:hypothetical protein
MYAYNVSRYFFDGGRCLPPPSSRSTRAAPYRSRSPRPDLTATTTTTQPDDTPRPPTMDYTSDTRAVLDYIADECVLAPPEDPSPTALTGADPALVKLLRKLEVCDSVDDADARRGFVAKHAKAFGLSVAVVLARLRVAGALTAEEVRHREAERWRGGEVERWGGGRRVVGGES